jgi:hypothetical protein
MTIRDKIVYDFEILVEKVDKGDVLGKPPQQRGGN